jgi:hypothetical protein
MYGAIYDEKHRFNVLTTQPDSRDRIEQSGIREKLLCRECEQSLSKHEHYASLVFKGGVPGMDGGREGSIVWANGIDYPRFKLFLISLLWRAGASKLGFFEHVKLGHHQERLRHMLINNDPGDYDQYACLLWGINSEPNETPGFLLQPTKDKVCGQITFHFVMPGLKLAFFVSKQKLGKPLNQFVLQQDGSLAFQVRSPHELPSLNNFMTKYASQGRRPPLET